MQHGVREDTPQANVLHMRAVSALLLNGMIAHLSQMMVQQAQQPGSIHSVDAVITLYAELRHLAKHSAQHGIASVDFRRSQQTELDVQIYMAIAVRREVGDLLPPADVRFEADSMLIEQLLRMQTEVRLAFKTQLLHKASQLGSTATLKGALGSTGSASAADRSQYVNLLKHLVKLVDLSERLSAQSATHCTLKTYQRVMGEIDDLALASFTLKHLDGAEAQHGDTRHLQVLKELLALGRTQMEAARTPVSRKLTAERATQLATVAVVAASIFTMTKAITVIWPIPVLMLLVASGMRIWSSIQPKRPFVMSALSEMSRGMTGHFSELPDVESEPLLAPNSPHSALVMAAIRACILNVLLPAACPSNQHNSRSSHVLSRLFERKPVLHAHQVFHEVDAFEQVGAQALQAGSGGSF